MLYIVSVNLIFYNLKEAAVVWIIWWLICSSVRFCAEKIPEITLQLYKNTYFIIYFFLTISPGSPSFPGGPSCPCKNKYALINPQRLEKFLTPKQFYHWVLISFLVTYIFIYMTFLCMLIRVTITSCVYHRFKSSLMWKKNIFYYPYHSNNFFFYLWQSVNIVRNRSILNFYLRPYLYASGPFVPDEAIRTCQPLFKETEF